MTIPILPGPFSFLTNVGGALGEASRVKEQKRIEDVNEARGAAQLAIELRDKGYIHPEQFNTDEMRHLFQIAGLEIPSSAPTPEEQKRELTGHFLQAAGVGDINIPLFGMGGAPIGSTVVNPTDSFTPEQRAIIGAPEQSAIGVERAKVSALKAGGAQGRAVSGVPSRQVATAAEAEKVASAFKSEAPGFVALATRGVKLSSVSPEDFDSYVNAAWQAYVDDAKANNQAVLPERQAKRYFADALQQAIDNQQKLDIARLGAANRGAYAQDPEIRDLNVEHDNLNTQKTAAEGERNKLVTSMGGALVVANMRANPALAQLFSEQMKQLDDYDAKIADLNNRIADNERRARKALDARYPQRPEGQPAEGLRQRQEAWDNMLTLIRAGSQSAKNPRQVGETPEQYNTRLLGPRP